MTDSNFPKAERRSQRTTGSITHAISRVVLVLRGGTRPFDDARSAILKWLAARAGRQLPQAAWNGDSFELEEVGAQRTEAVFIQTPRFWAARLDDADKKVPLRTWVTEAALGERTDGSVVFGAKLTAVVRNERSPFDRTVPGFVRQIVRSQSTFLNGRMIDDQPWLVRDENDVDTLVRLICDQVRRADVIVAALADGTEDLASASVDLVPLAVRTVGAAHVVAITEQASHLLGLRLGSNFSLRRQAVRTYRPDFNAMVDQPYEHPLGLAHHIADWTGGGSSAYSRLIISQALIRSTKRIGIEEIPSFNEAKRVAMQVRLANAVEIGSSDKEILKLFETENENLISQLEEAKEQADTLLLLAEDESKATADGLERALVTIKHLRSRLERLQQVPLREQELPTTFDDIKTWCEDNLAGSVELLGRAYRGIRESEYHDAQFIYKVLLLLKDYYVPMRRSGGLDTKASFLQACASLNVKEEWTGSEICAAEFGEEYYVRYGRSRRFLERHIAKGTARTALYCFRLYFFWDDELEVAVVGWLPSHLTSRLS